MVRQIPGFSISGDDDGSRGFGQASGNVLINGQRVSGKSNGARNALSRIPADNVERIEIVDGASLDVPGLSGQVANIVAKASEGVSGSWRWQGRLRETNTPYLDSGEISASGKSGNVEWTIGFESDSWSKGGDRIRASLRCDRRSDRNARRKIQLGFGQSKRFRISELETAQNGDIANLNASYTIFEFDLKEISLRQSEAGGPRVDRRFERSEDEWNTELGGDYEFGVGSGRFKLIGLYRFEHSPVVSRVFSAAIDASSAEEEVFTQTIDETENILRGEYSWVPQEGRDWQIAIEGAFNQLESESAEFAADKFRTSGAEH